MIGKQSKQCISVVIVHCEVDEIRFFVGNVYSNDVYENKFIIIITLSMYYKKKLLCTFCKSRYKIK